MSISQYRVFSLARLFVGAALLAFLAACGSGNNEGSASNAPALEAGRFIDAPVQGLSYTQEGWTARESNRFWQSVASSADGSKLVAMVFGGQIYTSSDSGLIAPAR